MAHHPSVLLSLLHRARRRQVVQLVAEQSSIALGAAMAGAVLLLLAGTQILDWYWLVILFAGSLGFGLWRALRVVPGAYAVAQQIDSRLSLADTLSTAYHFTQGSHRRASPELCEAQRARAEEAARVVDVAAVFPLVMPKGVYAAGGIALVALGMFALRYGITRSLDLRPSLVRIAYDTFFQPSKTADARNNWKTKIAEELQKLGINVNSVDAKDSELDPTRESALTAADSPEISSSSDSDNAKSTASNLQNEQESGEPGGDEKSERSSAGSDKAGNDQPPEGNDGSPQNGQQTPKPKDAKESQAQNSLLDKMRDAMSNLMNKLKTGSKQGESKQSAQKDSQNGSQSQQQGKGEKSQMAGKQQADGGDQQDPQGQEQSPSDQAQSAKGKTGERNADQKASQDAKSGIGKQDGDKSAREAEQLAAMGKISEILGKRAKDMSGEIMVEVSSGKQQLKTQYSSKTGAHAEAGGEINRDEVPIEYHEYVQQYFEQIRKAPAPAAPVKK